MNGGTDKQPDLESCKSFCRANYPSAKYFGYVSPDFPNKEAASACRCKYSNAGRRAYNGVFAGELGCNGELLEFWVMGMGRCWHGIARLYDLLGVVWPLSAARDRSC